MRSCDNYLLHNRSSFKILNRSIIESQLTILNLIEAAKSNRREPKFENNSLETSEDPKREFWRARRALQNRWNTFTKHILFAYLIYSLLRLSLFPAIARSMPFSETLSLGKHLDSNMHYILTYYVHTYECMSKRMYVDRLAYIRTICLVGLRINIWVGSTALMPLIRN